MNDRQRQEYSELSDAELVQRRTEIGQSLVRSNAATAVALLISIGLALAAVFYAMRAEENARSARQAQQRTTEELWKAQLARATALRLSGKVGRREESLEAIRQAVAIRPASELRDEAIATMALLDLHPGHYWHSITSTVNTYAFSPKLNYGALGALSGRVEVFGTSTVTQTSVFTFTNQAVASMLFSPDERRLAVRYASGAVRVWDVASGELVFGATYRHREPRVHSLGFAPSSRFLAVACEDNRVRVIDLVERQELPSITTDGPAWTAAFNPSESRLAVGVDQRIVIYTFPAGISNLTLTTPERIGLLKWHPDGHHVAALSPLGRVVLADPRSGECRILAGHSARGTGLTFDPAGRLLLSTSWDGTTRFWNARSGRPLLVTERGFALEIAPDGRRVGCFREGLGLGDWELTTSTVFDTVALPLDSHPNLYASDISPNGRWVAGVTREALHVWDRHRGQQVAQQRSQRPQGVAFTVDGRGILLSSEAGLQRVPVTLGPGTNDIRLEAPEALPGASAGLFGHGFLCPGPQPRFVAEGLSSVAVVDLAPPFTVRSVPSTSWHTSAASSPDGKWLAVSFWKGSGTDIWDLEQQRVVRSLGDEGGQVAFDPRGRWLVVGTSQEFLFYDARTWQCQRRVPRDTSSAIPGQLAFSADGGVLALTPTLRQIKLIEPDTGAVLATLDAPAPERINGLTLSRDGTVLAAATDRAEVQLWDLARLRRDLGAMNLDWPDAPQTNLVAAPTSSSSPGDGLSPHHGALGLAGTGAGLALLFALYNLRHHRKLVRGYEVVEAVAAQRRRDLHQAQTQLQHSEKMKALGTLAAGIAHDFNNLLSIIRMSGQLVRRQLQPTGPPSENLDAIEQAVGQGKEIVRSILGYSRERTDRAAGYSVNAVVSETLAMLSKQFLSGIVLELELDPATPPVRGDKSRLEQILLNLIVNASEAMRGQGRLTLSVTSTAEAGVCLLRPRESARYVVLRVRDQGPGIPPGVLPRIFEPFFSTKQTGTERGAGLGLTTVYSIAQQDGFGLEVLTAPGQGTTFRVVIPVEPIAEDAKP